MKSVTIRYRPVKWLPIYRTVAGSFPQNWGDVTAEQLVAIACLYKNRISELLFLKRMSGLPMGVLKRCDDYERFKLMEHLEFVGNRRPYHEFIVKKIKKGTMGTNGDDLRAPAGKLKGVSFGQFIFADTYFSNYQGTGNVEDLNKFIAALYLKPGEGFEEGIIERRHESIGKVDIHIREAIVLNYQLMHEWLALAYPLIFQKKETEDRRLETEDGKQETGNGNTWIKVFQNFVGDDILHDDVWASKPINTIFTYMTRKYKENARRK